MKRSLILFFLVTIIFSFNVTTCFSVTKITFMNSKGEIQAQMEDAAKVFEKENPGISIDVIAAPVGQSPWEKLMALYAAGNAPALIMGDATDLPKIKDKLADLAGEKWAKDIIYLPVMDMEKSGSKLFGFPMTVEGFSIAYNKAVLDKAGIDPTKIHTRKDLEAAFKKVEASGTSALTIGPMDWSLGAHFLALGYSIHSKTMPAFDSFLNDLKKGKIDLSKNKSINGLLDTFDLMKKYNINKKDPLSATYESVGEQFATGKSAFYFQGNWVWPLVSQFSPNGAFGYIPVPISDNAKDFGNSGIAIGITKFIGIDTTQNNKEQQDAAKKFLNWLVYSTSGQDVIVNKSNIIPAFKNIALELKDPLSKSIKTYMVAGQGIYAPNCPADHWPKVGASMQKYLVDKIDRAALLKDIQDYWKTVK